MARRGGYLLAGWVLLAPLAAVAAEIAGTAHVTDGDTLEIGGQAVRLFGIDAPEIGQRCGAAGGGQWDCGRAAAARLTTLAAGRELRCDPVDRDGYGRIVATCAGEDGDLGTTLVAEGLAWAYLRYSHLYAEAEGTARAARIGIWQGAALAAWDYRAGTRQLASGGPPAGCAIKGNITATGRRIYHTPGSPWYARVRLDPSRGERWFCDTAEAELAGWRAAAGQ